MPYYSDDIIDRVRDASDILDVIAGYLPLKRKGRNWWGKCPFHNEKTPSFSVSPDKQIYHCFGCHKGGNVFSFIVEFEKIPFPEAVKLLAARANITLPEKAFKRESKENDLLYWANEVAAEFYFENLKDSRKSLDYLKQRKLNDEIILEFKIGYAPDSWDSLINHAKDKSLSQDDLIKAGLVVKNENGKTYDRFRDRLIFPIFNSAHKPIAFGARTFKTNDDAKYINSPETPLYHKASVLYGLSHSRGEIRHKEEAIVVEGYFDFLSLYQAGVKNVSASSGTAFTPEQAMLLKRSASSVILMFDSDSAGKAAAVRSVDFLFEAGLEVRVVSLPKGDDPDSIVRNGGREAVEAQIARAQSYVQYALASLGEPWEKASLGTKDKTIKYLADLANKIDDPIRRELFLQEISKSCGIGISLLRKGVKPGSSAAGVTSPQESKPNKLESDLLSLLLTRPDMIESAAEKITAADFENQSYADIFRLMVLLREEEMPVTAAHLIDKVESLDKKETIAMLASADFDTADMVQLFTDLTHGFNRKARDRKLTDLKRLLQKSEQEGDEESVKHYFNEIRQLKSEH